MSEHSILFMGAAIDGAKIEALLREGSAMVFEWHPVDSLLDGLRSLQERSFDVILCNFSLPDGEGSSMLRNLRQHAPNTPLILLCRAADRDSAMNAVREGAFDFFCYEDIDAAKLRSSFAGAMKHAETEADRRAAEERRNNARFPCRLAISYQTLERPLLTGQGTSETLNISSKGLLFRSDAAFEAGQLVQVSLEWPARLENQIPLKLVAEGRIVRSAQGQTAMTIEKYEFRTRRTPVAASILK